MNKPRVVRVEDLRREVELNQRLDRGIPLRVGELVEVEGPGARDLAANADR